MPNLAPPGGLGANDTKPRFIAAVRQQESGGYYLAVNAGSGALGAYQVMPANLPGWLQESGLPPMSAYAYLHDPAAQDRLAWVILGGYYDRYGAAGAAATWYSGRPDPNATYGDPPVWRYVDDVLALEGAKLPPVHPDGVGPTPNAFTLPPPNEGDWSAYVNASADIHNQVAGSWAAYSAIIRTLY